MNFWKKLRLLGSILVLGVGALTLGAAFVLSPDSLQPAPRSIVPAPAPGGGGLTGTSGL